MRNRVQFKWGIITYIGEEGSISIRDNYFLEKVSSTEFTSLQNVRAFGWDSAGFTIFIFKNGFEIDQFTDPYKRIYLKSDLRSSFEQFMYPFEDYFNLLFRNYYTSGQNLINRIEVLNGDLYYKNIIGTEIHALLIATILACGKMLDQVIIEKIQQRSLTNRILDFNAEQEVKNLLSKVEKNSIQKLLTFKRQKAYTKTPQIHHFVISRTKETDNTQIGMLGERAFYKYFQNELENTSKIRGLLKLGDSPLIFVKCEIKWMNEIKESYKPFDFLIELDLGLRTKNVFQSIVKQHLIIEVKTTRTEEDSVFFLSSEECRQMSHPNYLIARVSLMNDDGVYSGIIIHEEFCVNFYRPTEELIKTVNANLQEWIEHYGANEIRFKVNLFELLV